MRTFIFRDFLHYGDISIFIVENNYIEVVINKLHDFGEGIEANMSIKYNSDDLYKTIYTILDKISYDLHYSYMKPDKQYHKDFILHDHVDFTPLHIKNAQISHLHTLKNAHEVGDLNVQRCKYPEIWNYDVEKNKLGAPWINFTRENIKYVTIGEFEPELHISENKNIVIKGEVTKSGEFIYDFPIIGSNCTIKQYNESRGAVDYTTPYYKWRYG